MVRLLFTTEVQRLQSTSSNVMFIKLMLENNVLKHDNAECITLF